VSSLEKSLRKANQRILIIMKDEKLLSASIRILLDIEDVNTQRLS